MPQEGQFGSGSTGGVGTVTSVSGTANQIDVSGGTGAAVVSLDAVALAGEVNWGGTTAGTATAQTLTVPNIPATATTGTRIAFLSGFASTGATTLTVTPTGGSAWATLNLMKRVTGGVAALSAAGDMTVGGIYEAMYDGTQWVLATTSSTVYTAGALTTAGIITGNSANQVAGTSLLTTDGTHAFFAKINSETLAAFGVPYVRGVTSQKAETSAADANVLTVTPAASIGTYRVTVAVSVSAATAGVIGWTLSWTDSNGNAQSNIAQNLFQGGTAVPALTFVTSAAGNYIGDSFIDVNTAAAAIVVKWVGGGTSSAAKMSAIIERMQ